jgi:hypothetical protein
MNQMDIKGLITDLCVVLNKLADAKRDAQKHMQGYEDEGNLLAICDMQQSILTDVSCDIDETRDDIFKLVDRLEGISHGMDMAELSSKVWES